MIAGAIPLAVRAVNAGSVAVLVPAGTTAPRFRINAGRLTLCVPSATALDVAWSGALASNNFDDAGPVRNDDNHWISAGLSSAAAAVSLDISANAGSFTLLIGDTCNA